MLAVLQLSCCRHCVKVDTFRRHNAVLAFQRQPKSSHCTAPAGDTITTAATALTEAKLPAGRFSVPSFKSGFRRRLTYARAHPRDDAAAFSNVTGSLYGEKTMGSSLGRHVGARHIRSCAHVRSDSRGNGLARLALVEVIGLRSGQPHSRDPIITTGMTNPTTHTGRRWRRQAACLYTTSYRRRHHRTPIRSSHFTRTASSLQLPTVDPTVT